MPITLQAAVGKMQPLTAPPLPRHGAFWSIRDGTPRHKFASLGGTKSAGWRRQRLVQNGDEFRKGEGLGQRPHGAQRAGQLKT